MFNEPFDINHLLMKGYFRSSISKVYADMLLREVKREHFQEDVPDEPDYVGYEEKYYQNRFISSVDRSNQSERSPIKTMMANAVIAYQKSLIRYYVGGSDLAHSNVTSYEGKQGFMMDWHQDIGDRSITETVIYLCDQEWQPGFGGEIEIAEVERNAAGKIIERKTIEVIPPRHGDFVILENLSPHFEHRVLPWKCENSRYTVIVIAGILQPY